MVQQRRGSDPLGLISPGKPKLAPKKMQSKGTDPEEAEGLESQLARMANCDSEKVNVVERGGLDSSFSM